MRTPIRKVGDSVTAEQRRASDWVVGSEDEVLANARRGRVCGEGADGRVMCFAQLPPTSAESLNRRWDSAFVPEALLD